MAIVKYPYRVKIDKTYYAPNTPIAVTDAEIHQKNGAIVIEGNAIAPQDDTIVTPKVNATKPKAKPRATPRRSKKPISK